jgi:hypothetical protein
VEPRSSRNDKDKQKKLNKWTTIAFLIFFGLIIFYIGYGYGQASQYNKTVDDVRTPGLTENE